MLDEKMGSRRQRILGQVGHLAEQEITVPDWGEKVIVRELTGRQSREFEAAVARGVEAPLGFLLQQALVDPESKQLLFEPADRASLEEMGMVALKPVIELIQQMSGLTQADVDKAKAVLRSGPQSGPSS